MNAPWTIDDFFYDARKKSEYDLISTKELEGILDAYNEYWVCNDVTFDGLSEWLHTKFRIPNVPDLSYREVERRIRHEIYRMERIRMTLKDRDIYTMDVHEKFKRLERIHDTFSGCMLATFNCLIMLNPNVVADEVFCEANERGGKIRRLSGEYEAMFK